MTGSSLPPSNVVVLVYNTEDIRDVRWWLCEEVCEDENEKSKSNGTKYQGLLSGQL